MAVTDPDKLALFGGKPGESSRRIVKAKQDALGNKIPEPEEEVQLLEKEIQEVKVGFEKYFSNQDRRAPLRHRDKLWERFRKMKANEKEMPTAVRFRVERAQARFAALDRMWVRTMAEREAGRFSKDLFNMRLKQRQVGEKTAPPNTLPVRPLPVTKTEAGLSDGQVQRIYETLLVARARTNESTEKLSPDSLARTLRKQIPDLLERFKCEAVDFKVVIREGKAIIKAVPRT